MKEKEKGRKGGEGGNAPEPGTEGGFRLLPELREPVQNLFEESPVEELSKIRAVKVETEEEGELLEMVPETNRAMKLYPHRILSRIQKGELKVDDFDRGYREFHDALHSVRRALFRLREMSGFKEGPPAGGVPSGATLAEFGQEGAPCASPPRSAPAGPFLARGALLPDPALPGSNQKR